MEKKLYRSTNKMISGVCAGVAEYLNLDPTIARIVFAILSLIVGAVPGILVYIILLFIMPERA